MKVTRRRLYPFAYRARRFAERLNTDILPEDVYEDMNGGCAITSAYLHQKLRSVGFPSRVVIGAQHTFVRVGDWYIDVTATQFGYARIYIEKTPPSANPEWYEEFSTDNIDTLLTYMEGHGWPWDAKQINKIVLRKAA